MMWPDYPLVGSSWLSDHDAQVIEFEEWGKVTLRAQESLHTIVEPVWTQPSVGRYSGSCLAHLRGWTKNGINFFGRWTGGVRKAHDCAADDEQFADGIRATQILVEQPEQLVDIGGDLH